MWYSYYAHISSDLRDLKAENQVSQRTFHASAPLTSDQVFFIDYTGALCSKSSGHAIDIEGEATISKLSSQIRGHFS